MSVRVKFEGVEYWLMCEPDGDFGALAPIEHCNAEGHIDTLEHALSESFAHLFPDGRLMRHGQQIGTREDLERA